MRAILPDRFSSNEEALVLDNSLSIVRFALLGKHQGVLISTGKCTDSRRYSSRIFCDMPMTESSTCCQLLEIKFYMFVLRYHLTEVFNIDKVIAGLFEKLLKV